VISGGGGGPDAAADDRTSPPMSGNDNGDDAATERGVFGKTDSMISFSKLAVSKRSSRHIFSRDGMTMPAKSERDEPCLVTRRAGIEPIDLDCLIFRNEPTGGPSRCGAGRAGAGGNGCMVDIETR
jgi:hypothetical protein